jgi:hypothetical protein
MMASAPPFALASRPCSTSQRRFAVHALGQAERLRAANGRGRYSLWTGDVGTALFAAACLDLDARYPILDFV